MELYTGKWESLDSALAAGLAVMEMRFDRFTGLVLWALLRILDEEARAHFMRAGERVERLARCLGEIGELAAEGGGSGGRTSRDRLAAIDALVSAAGRWPDVPEVKVQPVNFDPAERSPYDPARPARLSYDPEVIRRLREFFRVAANGYLAHRVTFARRAALYEKAQADQGCRACCGPLVTVAAYCDRERISVGGGAAERLVAELYLCASCTDEAVGEEAKGALREKRRPPLEVLAALRNESTA